MGHSKRKRGRVPKKDRKNLRLWAEGARQTILEAHVEPYGDAMERGWREERAYFQRIINEYHARIPWRLEDHEEPPLPLAPFDPEARLPDPEDLSEAEDAQREARIALLNKRIRRWFKYRVKRLRRHVRTKGDSRKDPWAVLLAKLSGVTSPPKARQAYQQFMHELYNEEIEPLIKKRWAESSADGASVPTSKEPNAPFRAKIARELFGNLPEAEREAYGARAKLEAVQARTAYSKALNAEPSKSPEARQKAIDNLGTFAAPILQGIHERTGMHSVLVMGGPVPKYGGDVRTIQ
ncbi:hypothetical protein DFH06DRAFT_1018881 [Mycena polygramma]|nr:hypothetical protein DFH06DRAFT_1018881 [Mycena polygramma]